MMLLYLFMREIIRSWLSRGVIFAKMGWSPCQEGELSFIMLPCLSTSGSSQHLLFLWFLEVIYTSALTGFTCTLMKPFHLSELQTTRHSHDSTSTKMVILRFSPLQLTR